MRIPHLDIGGALPGLESEHGVALLLKGIFHEGNMQDRILVWIEVQLPCLGT